MTSIRVIETDSTVASCFLTTTISPPKFKGTMDSLPLDMSHPAVREYLSLIRLQVLTPLSLLINIASVIVCQVVVNPSISKISKQHQTTISPNPSVVAVYVMAIFAGQIGYCLLLVVAKKSETKKTLIKGPGFSLVLANWVMAIWAVTWIMQWFLAATILQGLLLLLLLYSNIVLLVYHPPTSERPFDTMLIHAPMRFFLVLQLSLMFPLSLFVTLGLSQNPDSPDYNVHQWAGFGVVLGTNLLGLIVVMMRRDIVWCVAAVWICVSIWTLRPKPAPVYVTVLIFTALHPLALVASAIYQRFYKERGIALLGDEEQPRVNSHRSGANGSGNGGDSNEIQAETRPPREVDEQAVWG